MGEDASLVHLGQGPTVVAMLRDAALSLLHRAGGGAITTRLRHLSQHPEQAVALVCNPPPTHASALGSSTSRVDSEATRMR